MKIKQVCDQTGLTARTVRFYSERGLIHPTCYEQNERNYYEYSPEDVQILRRVSVLRKAEFSLDEIRRMMCSAQEARRIVLSHMQKLKEREERTARMLVYMQKLCDRSDIDFETFANALEAGANDPV